MRIIVVDNAPFVRQLSATSSGNAIPEVLKGIGVVDHILNDAETALEALASEPYDALVLGPFANAHLHDFVKPAEKSRTAIIVVSTPVPGREAHESRCSMLAAGADDVMTTPINGEELRCRVLACVRRKRFALFHNIIKVGDLMIDVDAHAVFVCGVRVKMTPLEYSIFETLLLRSGRVVSTQEIASSVWSLFDSSSPSPDTIKVCVSRMRKRFAEAAGSDLEFIMTIWGFGYSITDGVGVPNNRSKGGRVARSA